MSAAETAEASTCCGAANGENVRLEYVTAAVSIALLMVVVLFAPSSLLVTCYVLVLVASLLGVVSLKHPCRSLLLASASVSVAVSSLFIVLLVVTVVGLVRAIQNAEQPEHHRHEHSYIVQVLLTGVVIAGGLLLFGLSVSFALAAKHVRNCRRMYRKGSVSPFSVVYVQEDDGQPPDAPLPVSNNWPPPYSMPPPPPYNESPEAPKRYHT